MKKETINSNQPGDKKGYNEKNPGQPQGAFPPDSDKQPTSNDGTRSNIADKKNKQDAEKKASS